MKRQLTVISGAAFALVLGVSLAAQAAPPTGRQGTSGNITVTARTNDGRAVDNDRVAAEVAAYWTPERMATAVDMDKLVSTERHSHSDMRKPDGPQGRVAPATSETGEVGVLLNESQTVGKVYFTIPGIGNASCSASTVNSGKKRLVMTAGHCVYYYGRWFTNWQFVPRYRDGNRPFGTWTARQLTSRTAWVNNLNSDEDMGIAIMNTNAWGQLVVNVVGGNGLDWNWGYSTFVTALGYPSNLGGGESQYYCQGTTWNGHSQQVRMYCNMEHGSSGGPWLHNYNDQNGLGYINSVVSHGHGTAGQFDGPYFDNDIKSLYDFAESLSP